MHAHDHYHSLRHLHDRYDIAHVGTFVARFGTNEILTYMASTYKRPMIFSPSKSSNPPLSHRPENCVHSHTRRTPCHQNQAQVKWYSLYQTFLNAPDGPNPPARELHDVFVPLPISFVINNTLPHPFLPVSSNRTPHNSQ